MSERIKELDGIRGLAILMVIIWHYITCLNPPMELGSFWAYLYFPTTLFWSGVDLFFVLSGFLIGGIILDNYRSKNFLSVFWWRRCFRIFPVLFVLLAACWMLYCTVDVERYKWLFENLMPGWSYLTFTQNIFMGVREVFGGGFLGVTWSLAVEEQFYLITPLLILFLGHRRFIRILFPLILLAIVLRWGFPGFHARVNMIFRMDSLFSGVLLAAVMRHKKSWGVLERNRRVLLVLFIGMMISTGALLTSGGLRPVQYTWFSSIYLMFLTLTLLYRGSWLTFPLRTTFLGFWGSIAYGLYMVHQAVLGLLHGGLQNGASPDLASTEAVWITVLSFGISTVLAYLIFRTVEAYFLRIGKRKTYSVDDGDQTVHFEDRG